MIDTKGVIYRGRANLNQWKSSHAIETDERTLDEVIQRELQGVGYFNHANIDVFREVILSSSVFAKKEQYKQLQKQICEQLNLVPSDSFLIGTTKTSK